MKRILVGRRFRRVMFVLWATLLLGSFGAFPAAGGESQTYGVSQTGYFTKTQDPTETAGGQVANPEAPAGTCKIPYNPSLPAGGGNCINPAGVTGGTPGWPRKDNYVYVAKIEDDEDAIGIVTPDLSSLPFGAIISSIRFEFQIENEADTGTINYDPAATSPIKACLATSDWAPGDAGAWELKPNYDCATESKPAVLKQEVRREPDATGTLRDRRVVALGVDLMPMAEQWAKDRPNFGVALVTTVESPSDFQVAIRTNSDFAKDAMVTRVNFDAPDEDLGLEDFILGGEETVSFGDFSGDVPATGPFSTVPPPAISQAAAESRPVTPAWVWSIVPIGLAGLALLARVATAEVELAAERVGPVGRLMQRRSAGREET